MWYHPLVPRSSTSFLILRQQFFTTIDQGLEWEPARTIGSYLWYRAYVDVTPDTCFVLDDGNGRVVGYCIGAADTAIFAQRWREVFTPVVDPVLVPRPEVRSDDPLMEKDDIKGFREAVYNAHCSMLQSWPETLQKYPAHLHIDLLPEFQRKGYGRELMNTFCEAVKSRGATGVHLDMVQHNTNGRAFYERVGFQICSQVLDGGASGRTGVNGIVVTLVKSF
jgi:ribosomal protein S18 acetylase RimI-like enzyme